MTSASVLNYFKEITTIPRESGHEEPMTAYLQSFAASHNLECKTDETGNVLIIKEAAPGKENVPAIVLQGHQDMVCEKNAGVQHDFAKDPIKYVVEDGWMIAKDTTLGADDGIGIAASLALLESDVPMGRVECLFTISEETGMDGAEALEEGFFTGKTLINLDSEEEGEFCIGCAGGLNTLATFKYDTENRREGYTRICLRISGGIGGHSGEDINKERMNTIQQMARFLYSELPYEPQLLLLKGGNKPNAIARECEAVLAVPDAEATFARFEQFGKDVKGEFSVSDPNVTFCSEYCYLNEKAVDADTARRFITALFTCPHGVQAMSQEIKGLVETSTNLASVRMTEHGVIRVITSQRSSITSARKMIAAKVKANFEAAGAEVEHQYEYPGWKPDTQSHVLHKCIESYKKLFGVDPIVKAIHAGLECGLFLEKFHDLDMISFGPTLLGVHAPGERMELASLDKFVALLEDVVANFE
ncbi:MAG: aminoacyl-histidine dipeptidase [Bacteroidia bacterium]|nr:aminoacyl-histidine dipeptidase [Bacteroidia bacterium]